MYTSGQYTYGKYAPVAVKTDIKVRHIICYALTAITIMIYIIYYISIHIILLIYRSTRLINQQLVASSYFLEVVVVASWQWQLVVVEAEDRSIRGHYILYILILNNTIDNRRHIQLTDYRLQPTDDIEHCLKLIKTYVQLCQLLLLLLLPHH